MFSNMKGKHPALCIDRILLASLLMLRVCTSATPQCRCFPRDRCWPTPRDWAKLNSSVDGQLIATIPLESPCHDPTYDAAKCQIVQQDWMDPSEQ
jgi:hypothetical protein